MSHQRHPRGGGDPGHFSAEVPSQLAPRVMRLTSPHPNRCSSVSWIPASAGMTSWLIQSVLVLMITATGAATPTIAQAPEVVFDLKVEKGKVALNMRLIRVKQGDAVKLRWTTDRPIVLHLHGYDIERKVEPGAATEMAFEARATGRFPIEEHKPNAKGGHSHGEAPLVRIEVRPR
jgi:hypothetical protein